MTKRKPLGERRIIKDAYSLHGVPMDSIEQPGDSELLYDIAESLRLVIEGLKNLETLGASRPERSE